VSIENVMLVQDREIGVVLFHLIKMKAPL